MSARGERNAAGLTMEQWCEEFGGGLLVSMTKKFMASKHGQIVWTRHSIAEFKEAALLGLLKSWHKYQPGRGMKPSSFAAQYMTWTLQNYYNGAYVYRNSPIRDGGYAGGSSDIGRRLMKMRIRMADHRKKHGTYPPSSEWERDCWMLEGRCGERKKTDYGKRTAKRQYQDRVGNLTLLATHSSTDEFVGKADGIKPVRRGDLIADEGPRVEDRVETKIMAEKVLGHLAANYTPDVADKFLAYASNTTYKSGRERTPCATVKRVLGDLRRAFA